MVFNGIKINAVESINWEHKNQKPEFEQDWDYCYTESKLFGVKEKRVCSTTEWKKIQDGF
ncbi:hypothetical protein HTG_04500 [Natrinema mahii]|nr:hypothetical protein HTG_04500 [Natrinema mahii]